MAMPTEDLDQSKSEQDDPGHDAADRCYGHLEGHPIGRWLDQAPDAEAEADQADQAHHGARADRD